MKNINFGGKEQYTMKENNSELLQPEPRETVVERHDGRLTIGMVGNYSDTDETRYFLTPEACGLLTSDNLRVLMQKGAASDINFRDEDYANYGVEITSRLDALKADIVLSYAPLRVADIRHLRKQATLLCMMGDDLFKPDVINALLKHEITLGCFDNMLSFNNESVFANIIDEIDGRAAVMYAQDFLSFTGGGKGVLLAGVAGMNPCEVLIIGEGNDVNYAALAAMAAGADVTLMNNDISALQSARSFCGDNLRTLAIHPRVLANKIKSADVILIGNTTRPFNIPKSLSAAMKDSAYVLNFKESHPSVSVPRTVAMALSNVMVNFFEEMIIKNGFTGMVQTTPGVQAGIVTFRGKLVDKLIGTYLGLPCVDLNMMLAHTN